MAETAPIRIDGSFGEGGGQIIRTCLSLSAVTGRPVEIENVRAGRSKPGLQPQHLAAVRAAARLCSARVEGDRVGSSRITFTPGSPVQASAYQFEIGTAGSAPLVAQTVMVPLALADGRSNVTVTGGTHVPHSPPFEYLERIYAPTLAKAGFEFTVDAPSAGFFPQGGGEVVVDIPGGAQPSPLDLTERGRLVSLTAVIVTANLPGHVAERGSRAVEKYFKGIGRSVSMEIREMPSISTGAAVVVVACCEGAAAGFTALGERGKPMERVAEDACEAFMPWWKSGAACDERLSDQLVLPMALAPGESRWTAPRASLHLRTALWATQHFLPIEYTLDESPDGVVTVSLHGAGPNRTVAKET